MYCIVFVNGYASVNSCSKQENKHLLKMYTDEAMKASKYAISLYVHIRALITVWVKYLWDTNFCGFCGVPFTHEN